MEGFLPNSCCRDLRAQGSSVGPGFRVTLNPKQHDAVFWGLKEIEGCSFSDEVILVWYIVGYFPYMGGPLILY